MSTLDSAVMCKGDELFVLTLVMDSETRVLTFTSEEQANNQFTFLSSSASELGINKIYFTNSFLNVTLQEEYLMGEVH